MRIEGNFTYNYEIKQNSDRNQAKELLKDKQGEMERIKKEFEYLADETKQAQEGTKILITCLRISKRIIAGDIVPAKDHKFLRENDPALYARSLVARIPKKKPYKYKQLSEDDDKQNGLKDKGPTNGEGFNLSPSSNFSNSNSEALEGTNSRVDVKV